MTTLQNELAVVQDAALDLAVEAQSFLDSGDPAAFPGLESRLTQLLYQTDAVRFGSDQTGLNNLKANVKNCINIFIDLITIKHYTS
ncbi:hypothetical protein [Samia ricini nucleopolyhedrovirus]|nr:hypothetical protein [Philosamia cynthia ricini nucleopolyhedrovirus virus]BBD51145.1 hypothetical protein [Samia ricini nucleopolyhedrovirus]BBD51297.1 hypothetical protein [Samia ricini nucleopolyhedrovirus]BBD51449.1 hypothetical protein [Samia ricini nucleopolyhedrovirus]